MRSTWTIKSLSIIIFLMLLLSMLSPLVQGTSGISVSIGSTGTIVAASPVDNLDLGVLISTANYAEYDVSTIAAISDYGISWWYPPEYKLAQYDQKMSAVHAINPNYKFLIYRNCMSIYNYWPDELYIANSSGWLLKNANGDYVTEAAYPANYMVDITNSSYQQWLANKLETWLILHPDLNGVFLDNSLLYGAQSINGVASSTPINPATGVQYTDTQITNALVNMLNVIIDTIGTDKLSVANGIWNGQNWAQYSGYQYILSHVPRLSGLYSEGAFRSYSTSWYPVWAWQESIDFISWVNANFLGANSASMFSVQCITSVLPEGATKRQVMEFGLSSMLLAAGNKGNTINYDLNYSRDKDAMLFVENIRSLNLGFAEGSYYQINSTQVFEREFSAGSVLVNPSSIAYNLVLSRQYKTVDGNVVSGVITINPHTGMILLNQ